MSPGDLWVGPDGAVHLLWVERALDDRLREKFFPDARQSHSINYAVVRDGKVAALATLCCETDFVAKTDEFSALASEIAALVNAKAPRDVEEALLLRANGGLLSEKLTEKVGAVDDDERFAAARHPVDEP
jgi:hypothetical protein